MDGRPTAVLISGRGSNLAALIGAAGTAGYPARLVLVVSDVPDAAGLERARAAGVPTLVIQPGAGGREAFEASLDRALVADGVELVCLAGFMRILSARFVDRWRDRILNVHPSLLPAFRGLATHARALEAGVLLHGCTVHLVRAELDAGPVLVQGVTPVLPDDDEASLAARVLALEHRAYPLALALWARGDLRLEGGRVVGAGTRLLPDARLGPGPLSPSGDRAPSS